MKTRLPIACLGWVFAIAAFLILREFSKMDSEMRVDPQFEMKFESITTGLTAQEVVQLLGEPDDSGVQFRLGQRNGFETEYAAAERSGSVHYLRWYKGIDIVFTVGFDPQDKVSFKASGGT